MLSSYKHIQNTLETALSQTAFRRGTSAFRYGLIPEGISDHLPISMKLNIGSTEHAILSWNLLADDHLYNNFLNISGSSLLSHLINIKGSDNCYYSKTENKLFHFFSELSQYLFKNKTQLHAVTPELLRAFARIDNQPSLLARSRDAHFVKEKIAQVEKSRAELIEFFIQAIFMTGLHQSEFELMIKHALELIHHIQDQDGALRWKNRFNRLIVNKKLKNKINLQDIILLQEATCPKDILNLLPSHYQLIEHSLHDKTTDHCAIIYDANKYALMNVIKCNLEGKKPYIIAQLKIRSSGENFIVASIHHPGGSHDLRMQILTEIQKLTQETLPTFIAGDFNHCAEDFNQVGNDAFSMVYPQTGTSSGSDYGNLNKAIDGLMTNEKAHVSHLERVNEVGLSPPASGPTFSVGFFATKQNAKEEAVPQHTLRIH